MATLAWLIGLSLLMSCIALVGSLTLVLTQQTLDGMLLRLIEFAAGSLIGGALFQFAVLAHPGWSSESFQDLD